MKIPSLLVIGTIAVFSVYQAAAADTSAVMCDQFAVQGATYNVMPTTVLSEDFVPAHHAPRNIPISVRLPAEIISYIHFPIVENGTYVIYSTEPDRLVGLKEKSGEIVASTPLPAASACSDSLIGGLTSDIDVGELLGPKPIAIEFSAGPETVVRLVVSRSPINIDQ